jgi:hypothetical protein
LKESHNLEKEAMNLDKSVPTMKTDDKKSDDKNLNKNSLDLPPIE